MKHIFQCEGFKVGHYTDAGSHTGCTVILCPPSTVGGCDIRGNSPASRETALLGSEKSMQRVHAVVLTGGSAFGLGCADGVMRYLEERGIGYHTPWATVPIVPAAAIYDLNLGSSSVRPDAECGYAAAASASEGNTVHGNVGAGTGATVGKWNGMEYRMKSGVGLATLRSGNLVVSALAVVNAVGDVVDDNGAIIAGARRGRTFLGAHDPFRTFANGMGLRHVNTTLVVVATNARLQKVRCTLVAQRAHDGMARAIRPVHTSFDGDIAFALSSGKVDAHVDLVAEMGAAVTAMAIRDGVRQPRVIRRRRTSRGR